MFDSILLIKFHLWALFTTRWVWARLHTILGKLEEGWQHRRTFSRSWRYKCLTRDHLMWYEGPYSPLCNKKCCLSHWSNWLLIIFLFYEPRVKLICIRVSQIITLLIVWLWTLKFFRYINRFGSTKKTKKGIRNQQIYRIF
jgi:hypothetical protein